MEKNIIARSGRNILAGGLLMAGVVGLVGCDNVSENDRLIDYPLPEAAKSELIFEFTGQRCSNCPDGAKVIHDLQERYPSVIAVCVHPEGVEYTRPLGGLNLTSPTSTEIYNYYRPSSFPYAIFDGQSLKESENYELWSEAAINLVSESTPAEIEFTVETDASRNITLDGEVTMVAPFGAPMNIAAYLIEDGIIGGQVSSTGNLREYTHNHVLRTSFSGTWGTQLGASFEMEQVIPFQMELKGVNEGWKLENCQVVVFLSDPSSHKVYQAAIMPVSAAD